MTTWTVGLLACPGPSLHGQVATGIDSRVAGHTAPPRFPLLMPTVVSPLDRARVPSDVRLGRHLGASSCAAASCHNGPRPGIAAPLAARGSEHSLWRENDPHARAQQALCSRQGLDMLKRLNILRDGQVVDQDQYDNCLKCHNTMTGEAESCCGKDLREGVGCESCHGPSAQWIQRHYLRDWDAAFEFQNGYIPLYDLVTRGASLCCSVMWGMTIAT